MGIMQSQINEILQKRMDRKDFLKHVGIGVVALTGVTALVKSFSQNQTSQAANRQAVGYGQSVYGGKGRPVS